MYEIIDLLLTFLKECEVAFACRLMLHVTSTIAVA